VLSGEIPIEASCRLARNCWTAANGAFSFPGSTFKLLPRPNAITLILSKDKRHCPPDDGQAGIEEWVVQSIRDMQFSEGTLVRAPVAELYLFRATG
jgi:hypothetical protein